MRNRYLIEQSAVLAAALLSLTLVTCAPRGAGGAGGGGDVGTNGDASGGFGDFSFDLTDLDDANTNGTQPDDGAEAGAELFRDPTEECAVCHGTDAQGTAALGPALVGTSADDLAETLAEGTDHRGGARPDYTEEDLLNVEAFLATAGQDIDSNGADAGTNG